MERGDEAARSALFRVLVSFQRWVRAARPNLTRKKQKIYFVPQRISKSIIFCLDVGPDKSYSRNAELDKNYNSRSGFEKIYENSAALDKSYNSDAVQDKHLRQAGFESKQTGGGSGCRHATSELKK
jgi:hypothetical protein